MKKIYLFAAMAAMLAACSENDLTVEKQTVQQTDEQAVTFEVYVGRGLTRGGVNGPVTTTNLTTSSNPHQVAGFGVFGYYTDGEPYSAITKPNFFYNQQVIGDNATDPTQWTYTPVKYWPNEFGGDAVSDQVDRVTLFAYLPYVEVDPLTGITKKTEVASPTPEQIKATDPTTNITGMTRNTATGDPFIKYVATMDPTNSVDLCYGVAAENFVSSNSAVNKNDIKKGKPYIDVVKPGTDANSKIKFDFKHATAQMIVTIDAKVVDMTNNITDVETNHTRIWVRSVSFTGITQKGALCLNSQFDTPEWYDINGSSKITTGSFTIYDGRKDGKEANDGASNETPSTLNSNIIQDKQYTIEGGIITEPTKLGVTATKQNLFNVADVNAPVFVIPTKEKMRVTIVYDVETYDKNLPYYLSDGKTPGSTVQNTIYKDIDAFGDIAAGYCYTLNLHLGMRTVDFDAEVTDWKNKGTNVDLPSNRQTFTAHAPQNEYNVYIGANVTKYEFAVNDLIANKSFEPTATGAISASPISFTKPVTTNGAGIAECDINNIPVNTTVMNVPLGTIKLYDGSQAAQLTLTQLAHPLNMSINTVNGAAKTITLQSVGTTGTPLNGLTPTEEEDSPVKVWCNNTRLTTSEFSYANGVVTITAGFTIGNTYTIYVKSGDAAGETVTLNIGSISYAPTVTRAAGSGSYTHPLSYTGTGTITYEETQALTGTSFNTSTGELIVGTTTGEGKYKASIADDLANGWFYPTKEASFTLTVE